MNAEEIVQAMMEQGMRITEQRKTLAKLFADTEGYLTPKEVYEYMEKTYSGLSFDTVYRNLRLMHEMGVLEQFVFEDGIKFRVRCLDEHHHHHVFCLNCEKIFPVVFCPLQEEIDGLPDGFAVLRHKFEIYGLCKDCNAEKAADAVRGEAAGGVRGKTDGAAREAVE